MPEIEPIKAEYHSGSVSLTKNDSDVSVVEVVVEVEVAEVVVVEAAGVADWDILAALFCFVVVFGQQFKSCGEVSVFKVLLLEKRIDLVVLGDWEFVSLV